MPAPPGPPNALGLGAIGPIPAPGAPSLSSAMGPAFDPVAAAAAEAARQQAAAVPVPVNPLPGQPGNDPNLPVGMAPQQPGLSAYLNYDPARVNQMLLAAGLTPEDLAGFA